MRRAWRSKDSQPVVCLPITQKKFARVLLIHRNEQGEKMSRKKAIVTMFIAALMAYVIAWNVNDVSMID